MNAGPAKGQSSQELGRICCMLAAQGKSIYMEDVDRQVNRLVLWLLIGFHLPMVISRFCVCLGFCSLLDSVSEFNCSQPALDKNRDVFCLSRLLLLRLLSHSLTREEIQGWSGLICLCAGFYMSWLEVTDYLFEPFRDILSFQSPSLKQIFVV